MKEVFGNLASIQWIRKKVMARDTNLSYRMRTQNARKLPADFDDVKNLFLNRVVHLCFTNWSIGPDFILNADETGNNIIIFSYYFLGVLWVPYTDRTFGC